MSASSTASPVAPFLAAPESAQARNEAAAAAMAPFYRAFGLSASSADGTTSRQRKRAVYVEGERQASLGRLTTRCPTILRDYLKFTASNPMSGYRSFTHMTTMCLIEFLNSLPKAADPALLWAKGRGASDGTVLVHANTERTISSCGTACVEGCDLAARAIEVAETHGVNMSAFTLTLLFWMATVRHPPVDAKMKRAIASARADCF